MRHLILSVAMIGFAAPAFADDDHELKFTSIAGKYRIAFAGKPELKQETLRTEIGRVEVRTAIYVDDDKSRGMSVTYVDMKLAFDDDDADQFLKGATEGVENSFGGIAREVEKGTFGAAKYPARRFLIQNRKLDIWALNLLVLRDGRYYHVMVLGSKEYVTSRDAEVALASFEIIK